MPSEKQLTTTGKMPAARTARTNTSGLWLLNNFLIANQTLALKLLLRKLLLKAALLAKQNLPLASLILLLKNLNNFETDFCKKALVKNKSFFIACALQKYIPRHHILLPF